jgi:DNA-directed RNA polymerase specialized sigma24 family protein
MDAVSTCSPDEGDVLLTLLAHEERAYLRWLRGSYRPRLTEEECADVVQDAYVSALRTFRAQGVPAFPTPGHRTKWWQTVLRNTAVGHLRARDGRVRENAAGERTRAFRPALVPLDAPLRASDADGGAGATVADTLAGEDDVASLVTDAAELASVREVLARAFARLDGRHLRLLRFRYVDGLDPATICRLEGLDDVRTYEGRMRRALAALRPAVAGVQASEACRAARREVGTFLGGGQSAHLETCVACRAHALQLRGALVATPLPLLAWKGTLLTLLGGVRAALVSGGAGKAAAAVTVVAAVGSAGVAVERAAREPAARAAAAPTAMAAPARVAPVVPTAVATLVATPASTPGRRVHRRPARASTPTPTATPARTATPAPTAAPAPTAVAGTLPTPTPASGSTFAGEFTP